MTVATDGLGTITGQTELAVVPSASARAGAVYTPGARVVVALSLTSTSRLTQTSPSGLALTSSGHHYTCITSASVSVAPYGRATQYCVLLAEPVRADVWRYHNATARLSYWGWSRSGGSLAGYMVPAYCGDPAPAVAAVESALSAQLRSQTPAGSVVFYGPAYAISTRAVMCSPGPGYVAPEPFQYTQSLGGSATQSSFLAADVRTYQSQTLQSAALATDYFTVLRSTSVCPQGPTPQPGATPERASVTCPASAVAAWNWDTAALGTLAAGLRGITVTSASAYLNGLPGVAPGSVTIIAGGAQLMPGDASAITIQVT